MRIGHGSWRTGGASLALLLSGPVFADYQDSYRKGKQALDRKNWSGVLEWMGRAAGKRNAEGGDKINLYGMRFEHYLPHYYMGVAHFESGDPGATEAEWQISQQQVASSAHPITVSFRSTSDVLRRRKRPKDGLWKKHLRRRRTRSIAP